MKRRRKSGGQETTGKSSTPRTPRQASASSSQAAPEEEDSIFIPLNPDAAPSKVNATAVSASDLAQRDADDSRRRSEALAAASPHSPRDAAPWAPGPYQQRNVLDRLHEELIDFCTFMEPRPEEHQIRQDVFQRIHDVIVELFPGSEVHAFGSFMTKLYLPTSDIDLVVMRAKVRPTQAIEKLAAALKASGTALELETITSARIPLCKFRDRDSGIPVDISFDVPGGVEAAQLLTRYAGQFPMMRPLVVFLKYFLAQRKLNETYLGGIGSFLLQMMVISAFQLHPVRQSSAWGSVDKELSLGAWLVAFLELYGVHLNYTRVGIDVKRATYYSKQAKGRFDPSRPYLLSLENPLDPALDVGKNSYCIMRVRKAFHYAYQRVLEDAEAPSLSHRCPTLLSRIIALTPDIAPHRQSAVAKDAWPCRGLAGAEECPRCESGASTGTATPVAAATAAADGVSASSASAGSSSGSSKKSKSTSSTNGSSGSASGPMAAKKKKIKDKAKKRSKKKKKIKAAAAAMAAAKAAAE